MLEHLKNHILGNGTLSHPLSSVFIEGNRLASKNGFMDDVDDAISLLPFLAAPPVHHNGTSSME